MKGSIRQLGNTSKSILFPKCPYITCPSIWPYCPFVLTNEWMATVWITIDWELQHRPRLQGLDVVLFECWLSQRRVSFIYLVRVFFFYWMKSRSDWVDVCLRYLIISMPRLNKVCRSVNQSPKCLQRSSNYNKVVFTAPDKMGFGYPNNTFLFSLCNIYCGYSLEAPRWGASNETHNICFFYREIRKYEHFLGAETSALSGAMS